MIPEHHEPTELFAVPSDVSDSGGPDSCASQMDCQLTYGGSEGGFSSSLTPNTWLGTSAQQQQQQHLQQFVQPKEDLKGLGLRKTLKAVIKETFTHASACVPRGSLPSKPLAR